MVVSFAMQTFALDRAQLTQSKIQSALSSVLPRNDFLVIVNRLDTLDAVSYTHLDVYKRQLFLQV